MNKIDYRKRKRLLELLFFILTYTKKYKRKLESRNVVVRTEVYEIFKDQIVPYFILDSRRRRELKNKRDK